MLYPQILSAYAKDLVHVTPAMRIIPNTSNSFFVQRLLVQTRNIKQKDIARLYELNIKSGNPPLKGPTLRNLKAKDNATRNKPLRHALPVKPPNITLSLYPKPLC